MRDFEAIFALTAARKGGSAALEALLDPANKADNSVLITEGMGMKGAVSAISAGTGLAEDEITAAMADRIPGRSSDRMR